MRNDAIDGVLEEDLLDSGSDNGSDVDVPDDIWLPEFELSRR